MVANILQYTDFSCCRELNFQHNELLYCAARTHCSSKAYSALAISDKSEEYFFTTHTTNNGMNIVQESTIKEYKTNTFEALQFYNDLVEAQRGESDYCNYAGVRPKACWEIGLL